MLDVTGAFRLLIATAAILSLIVCMFIAAAHEDTRMQSVQSGVKAQAIERGAEIYAQYCADCHGRKGYGIVGHGPALNNPQLFGHDYLPEITKLLQPTREEFYRLRHDLYNLSPLDKSWTEISDRLQTTQKLYDQLLTEQKQKLKPAVNFGYDPERYNRLEQVGWKSSLYSFILTTLIHGRPVSSSYWLQAMPAYSKEASTGIVLDSYQLDDVITYILNWDKGSDWTLEDLYAVNQFAILPIDNWHWCCKPPSVPLPLPKPVGVNVLSITNELENVVGDPKRGDQLYNALTPATLTGQALPCKGCHQQSLDGIGPMTNGTFTRVVNERLKEPQFANHTPEQYLIESIVQPQHYIVPGFQDLMVRNLGTEVLDIQDLADIVAYLMTLK
ncbi:MAG: c-type cytochrome [Anaerolineaceae bacterium]|nr:c-type cytochrome [Anaerolineaceae bacterium]